MPHDHSHVIAECCIAGEKELKMAVDSALAAKEEWSPCRGSIVLQFFLKAADHITNSYRPVLNASTMLGQSKTVFQAEIDIAELADFLRFGVWSAQEIFKDQPSSAPVFGIAKTIVHWMVLFVPLRPLTLLPSV